MMIGGSGSEGFAHDQEGIIPSTIIRMRRARMMVMATIRIVAWACESACSSLAVLPSRNAGRRAFCTESGGRILIWHPVPLRQVPVPAVGVLVQLAAHALYPAPLGSIGMFPPDRFKRVSVCYDDDVWI